MAEAALITHCPHCGEPVKSHWRFCPVCETCLQELRCPVCKQAVKENWKRCPECETLLFCARCERRLDHPDQGCAYCRAKEKENKVVAAPLTFSDPVCGLEMVYVAGGTFQMGDTFGEGADSEKPVHEVTVSGFFLARHTITQVQWSKLMPDNPAPIKGDELPIVQITWEQAVQFVRLLSQAHEQRHIFDLPSEAEWEFAARSEGKQELYAGGSDIDVLAWYEDNSKGRPHPVGTKSPNGLGVFDMSGNVWEWCRDSYDEDAYTRHRSADSVNVEDAADKVIRGGSWHLDAWSARCARRLGLAPDFSGPALGLRLIMRNGT